MVWAVSRFRLKAPPGISSSCISPLTSAGQRSRASWASEPQKSAALSPQPGGKPRKFIRTCGGFGKIIIIIMVLIKHIFHYFLFFFTHMRARTNTHTPTRTDTYIHTYIHIYINTHTHTLQGHSTSMKIDFACAVSNVGR